MNSPNAMFTVGHNNMMQFKCALPVFSGNWESYTKKLRPYFLKQKQCLTVNFLTKGNKPKDYLQ